MIQKKIMSVLFLFCLLVLTNALVYPMKNNNQTLNKKGMLSKVLAAVGTSSAMHSYNQFFARMLPLRGIPASEVAQKLGKEAQTAIGIPADKQVSIQYFSKLDASAVADNNAIIIGDEFIDDKVAYGVKRCNMFHEAVHIKYHDQKFNAIPFFCSILGAPFATKMLIKPQGKLRLLYLPALFAGHHIGRAIQGQFENYRERRADIEGHYATQCHICVTEKVEDVRSAHILANDIISRLDPCTNLNETEVNGLAFAKDWIESKKSYLSIEENEIIAAELKRDSKVCAFHGQLK